MLGLRGRRSHETHAPADAMAEVVRRQARPLAPAACLVTGSSLRPLALSLRARGRPPTQRKQKWAACERGSAKTKLYGSMYRREIPEHAFVPSQPVEWLHCRHSQPELTGSNSPDRSLWPCHNVSLHLLHHFVPAVMALLSHSWASRVGTPDRLTQRRDPSQPLNSPSP